MPGGVARCRDNWTMLPLRAPWSDRDAAVLICASETSVNRIPVAMAQWLHGKFGGAIDRSIVRINRVGHTGSSGWNRLAHQALFEGEVIAGKHHVLVDDFVGQGGGRWPTCAATSLPRVVLSTAAWF